MAETAQKCAVVTGANKGIGLEICRQLASHGITVVLTARDEKKGLEAVEKLNQAGLLGCVIFHRLDVVGNSASALAEFIKSRFGKLDILVNNAGIIGSGFDPEALELAKAKAEAAGRTQEAMFDWIKIATDSYDLATEAIQTNYYGTKATTEALLPLLQLSNAPRIVNVSSGIGILRNLPSEWAKAILNDDNNLTEERIDEVVNEFLKDIKEGKVKDKGWPTYLPPYTVSKLAMNAYTRLLAKQYPRFRVNCVCPGYVKTDINFNMGFLTVEEGAEEPVKLALLPDDGPSGCFFSQKNIAEF